MSHPPSSAPVKVPASATTYTPATQDPDMRSQINALLIRDGHVEKIQEHLLHALNAHPTNWPTTVQTHALSLLRSGDVHTFPALIRRVLEDVRHETQAAADSKDGATSNGKEVNGASTNGSKAKAVNGTGGGGGGSDEGLAMPQAVVDEVLKVTLQSLETLCEIDDGGT